MTLRAVSLFLQILLRGARARALDRPAAKTRETRAPSTTRMGHFRVLRVSLSRTKENKNTLTAAFRSRLLGDQIEK